MARSGYFRTSYAADMAICYTRPWQIAAVGFLAVALLAPPFLSQQAQHVLNIILINVIAAQALNLLTGYGGQISLAHAGLLAAGAFTAGILAHEYQWHFIPAMVAVTLVGAFVGLLLGLPAIRLRGLYLVVATLAAHFVLVFVAAQYQSSRAGTAALLGLLLPPPSFGFFQVSTSVQWYYFLLAAAGLVTLFCLNLVRTHPGRAWVALRDRDLVGEALGISVSYHKIQLFVISSALTAMAGGLLAFYNKSVSAEYFTFDLAIQFLAMVIIGGMGSIEGAVFGAVFVTLVPYAITLSFEAMHVSARSQSIYMVPGQIILFAVLMVWFLLYEPLGLVGIWRRVWNYLHLWPLKHRPLAERRR